MRILSVLCDVVGGLWVTCSSAEALAVVAEAWASLRFLSAEALNTFLTEAGLRVHYQQGGWDGEQLSDASHEIITTTRRK